MNNLIILKLKIWINFTATHISLTANHFQFCVAVTAISLLHTPWTLFFPLCSPSYAETKVWSDFKRHSRSPALASCQTEDRLQTWSSRLQMSTWRGAGISSWDAGAQVGQSCTPSTAKHSESWTGKTHRSSLEAEDVWTTKLCHDWAIPMEQLANWSHRRDTQHFNLQDQTQNIFIQTVFPGRIETLYQLHERLCDGLAIKKRCINVLYITLHYITSMNTQIHINECINEQTLKSTSMNKLTKI